MARITDDKSRKPQRATIVAVPVATATAEARDISLRVSHPETGRGVTLTSSGLVEDDGVTADLDVVWHLGRSIKVRRKDRIRRGRPEGDTTLSRDVFWSEVATAQRMCRARGWPPTATNLVQFMSITKSTYYRYRKKWPKPNPK
jgi:hypothetical protein